MRADLHIHTTASDGRWTPERLISGIQEEQIELFAVTDHDSIDNVLPTEKLAKEAGISFLRGVEISATDEEHLIHILGYGIDLGDAQLLAMLEENRIKLEGTDDDDIRQLIAKGYPIEWADYEAYTYEPTRGGFKSFNYLLDQKICSDASDFFKNIRGLLKHQWPTFPKPESVTAQIRAVGGTPILAHPGASLEPYGGVSEEVLDRFLGMGIAGVECHSQYHDEDTTARCVAWCKRHQLLITGGSDYHGGFVNRKLGFPVVDSADLQLGDLLTSR